MPAFHDQYATDGFIRLKNGIPTPLLHELQTDFNELLAARDAGATSRDWRHQTILEPRHFRPSFTKFLDLPNLTSAAEDILATTDISFSGLAALLGRNVHSLCKWHRDFPDTDPEMSDILRHPTMFIQFNCAVFDDAALWIVPGSHRRPSLPNEQAFANLQAPLEFTGLFAPALELTPEPLSGMPGATHVPLAAGDCLLYNPVLWHAAEYRPDHKRATLHGGWRDAAQVDHFRSLRWGLDHNPWLLEPAYLGDLGPNFGPQLQRYQEQVRRHVPQIAPAS